MAKLPSGWSRPIKAAEATALFPMAGSVVWNGPPQRVGVASLPVVWLMWSPDSAQSQPTLTLWAVPSDLRHAIRTAVHEVVAEQAEIWFASTVNASDVARATHHAAQWSWTGHAMVLAAPQYKRRR